MIRNYLILLALVLPQVSFALVCEIQSDTELYDQATTVLIGYVESASENESYATIRVLRVLKGKHLEQFDATSSIYAGEIRFVKGGQYLLYLSKPDKYGNYRIGVCSGSVRMD